MKQKDNITKEGITFKGDREMWLKFTIELKKRKQKVWNVLKPFILNYITHKKTKR